MISKKLIVLSVILLGITSLISIIPKIAIAQTNPSPSFSKTEQYEAQRLQQEVRNLESQGKYSEAIPLAQRALELWERALGAENSLVAGSLNTLATLYKEQGSYNQAEPLYQRALIIYDKLEERRQNLPTVARILNNLAQLYQDQKDYAQSEPLYQRSLAIVEKLLGQEPPDTRTIFSNLATLYLEQGKYNQAEPILKRELAISENSPKYSIDIANSLNSLGSLYRRQGKYSQAEPLLKRALALVEKARGQEHPYGAFILQNLGLLYLAQGKYDRAEPLFQRSLAIREQVLGQEHHLVAQNLIALSHLYQAQGDIPRAIEFLSRSNNIEERNLAIALTAGSQAQERHYIDTLSDSTNNTISLHVQAAPNNPQAARLALTTILQRKNRVTNTSFDNLQTRLRLNLENRTLLARMGVTHSSLATSQNFLWKQLTTLVDRDQKLKVSPNRLSIESPIQNQSVTIELVQKLIPADAALVELALYQPFNPKAANEKEVFGSPRYVAYILQSQGVPQWVELGDATTINQAVTEFRRTVRLNSESQMPFKTAARALDKMLMQPIRQHLSNKRKVLLSPDSQLNL